MLYNIYDMRGKSLETCPLYIKMPGQYLARYKDTIPPIDTNMPIVICIDPSKTCAGVVVGDTFGNVIEIYECKGKTDYGTEDTEEYCDDLKRFFIDRFGKANIVAFYKEATILKKGIKYYHSMKVLESVAKTLNDVAKELTGSPAKEANNWSWKSHILPDGYRSQKEKGSFRYMCDLNMMNRQLNDNITDAYCIYLYVIKYRLKPENTLLCCNAKESTTKKFSYVIIPRNKVPKGAIRFLYSNRYSLAENISYYLNRSNYIGYCEIDINRLQAKDILGHCINVYPNDELAVLVGEENA